MPRAHLRLFADGTPPVYLSQDLQTGKLIWQDKAPQVSKPLADFIDDLMAFPEKRPQNTQVILQGLTKSSMFIRSMLGLFSFPKFRFRMAVL